MDTTIDSIAEAQRLKDAGQTDLAEKICRNVLLGDPTHAGALHLLGATLHLKGMRDEAIDSLQRAIAIEPKNASYLVTLGGNLAIAGRMEEATECFRRAVEANPASVEARYNLGLAHKHRKEYAEAETCFSAALVLAPTHIDAIANLGFVVLKQERVDEARNIFFRALSLAPTNPLSLSHLATILAQEGKKDQAHALLRAFEPNATEASLFQLASAYDMLGNNALTLRALRLMVEKYPNSAAAHAALANALIGDLQLTEGIAAAKKATSLDSNYAAAWCSLAIAYQHNGMYVEAHDAYNRTVSLTNAIGPMVMRDLMLPCIMGTQDEIELSRQVFERNLAALTSKKIISKDPLNELGFTYFYLAFQGKNDVQIQKQIARFYRQTAPCLNFVAPHCRSRQINTRKPTKLRVGFYSHFITSHSVSVCFAKVLEGLNAMDEFEIHLVSDAPFNTEGVAKMYPSLKDRAVESSRFLQTAQEQLSSLELDILIYLDIGMDPLTFLLAFSRLAPIQCVMTGHPVTTGIDTIDYFLSGELTEPDNGQEHYSEELIRFKHVGFEFQQLDMPTAIKTRAELGLPTSGRIYLCPMMLQKIHPDFDQAIEKILQKDKDGFVVLFESAQSPEWGRQLRKRFERTIESNLRDRIVFLPWMLDQKDFLCAIAQSDVVLDPFHFGIGTTSIYLCLTGTPFVTKPSEYMRGRAGYAYCTLLDIQECITHDIEAYVFMAIQIATDGSLRAKLKAKILLNNRRIFNQSAGPKELAHALRQLAARHS